MESKLVDVQRDAQAEMSIGQQVILMSDEIARFAEKIGAKAENKLDPVLRRSGPDVAEPDGGKLEESYPPLFDVLRSNLRLIRIRLEWINGTLDRVEV